MTAQGTSAGTNARCDNRDAKPRRKSLAENQTLPAGGCIGLTPQQERILEALSVEGRETSANLIAASRCKSLSVLKAQISKMRQKGFVIRAVYGREDLRQPGYRLVTR